MLTLVLLGQALAAAQTPQPLTLRQALEYLNQSPSVQQAQLSLQAAQTTGGLIGYGLSVLTVLLVTLTAPNFFPSMVLSPGVAALALGVSALIGLVFGVWPASRAANLTPIEALRYE